MLDVRHFKYIYIYIYKYTYIVIHIVIYIHTYICNVRDVTRQKRMLLLCETVNTIFTIEHNSASDLNQCVQSPRISPQTAPSLRSSCSTHACHTADGARHESLH